LRDGKPTGIGDILGDMKNNGLLGEQIDQARIWDNWEALVGPSLHPHGTPLSLKNGRLTVAVDSPVWMHKFTYRKLYIIGRINRMSSRELVSELFVILRDDDQADATQDGV